MPPSSPARSILYATTNPGKARELRALLRPLGLRLLTLKDVAAHQKLPRQVKETGTSFAQNARLKAQAYGRATGLLTLSDDSGLMVDHLNGLPGIHSRRYGPTDQARINKLLHQLKHVPRSKRTAKFVSAIAIYHPADDRTVVVTGQVLGRITTKPLGTHGFGYDPIFYVDRLAQTFAQATPAQKNRVSHRGQAMRQAVKIIRQATRNT